MPAINQAQKHHWRGPAYALGIFITTFALMFYFWQGVPWKVASYRTDRATRGAVQQGNKVAEAVAMMQSRDQESYEQSLFVIEQQGVKVVPDLNAMLVSAADDRTRTNVLYALGRLGKNAKSSIPVILKQFASENPDVRAVAAATLGRIGPDAKEALPYLNRLRADPNPWVRQNVNEALRSIMVNL